MTTRYYPKPQALADIKHDCDIVIEASAGTGKTYTLERLVVDILLTDPKATIDQILVVTFTERAAAELIGRVRGILEEVLTRSSAQKPKGDYWTIGPKEEKRIRQALFEFDQASIHTIHGFCQRALRENAFQNGKLFEQELNNSETLFEQAYRDVLRFDIHGDPIRKRLLDLFFAQVKSPVENLYKLLKETDKHARKLLAERDYASVFVPHWDRSMLSDGEEEEGGDLPPGVNIYAAVAQEFLPLVHKRIQAEKDMRGQIDYEDMILHVREAIVDKGAGETPLTLALRKRFRYALIDEFQDTDSVQWEIFKTIFADSPEHRLYLIGDPKQAIYGFRGADVNTYHSACDQIAGSEGRVTLKHNFRSTRSVINGYNYLLNMREEVAAADEHESSTTGADNVSESDPFFTDGIRYSAVKPGKEREEKGSGVFVLHYTSPEKGKNSVSERTRNRKPRNEDEQDITELFAKRIADEIHGILHDEKVAFHVERNGQSEEHMVGAGDIYILTRTNREALMAAEALRNRRIPFAFYKQDGLFKTPTARQIHTLLGALRDPGNRSNRLQAFSTPFFGVPWADLPHYREIADEHAFVRRLNEWAELARKKRFGVLFAQLLGISGYARRSLFLTGSEREFTNATHIFEVLFETAARKHCDLEELVRLLGNWLDGQNIPGGEDGGQQRVEVEGGAVRIMTVHASKGLEAPIVFLFGGFRKNPTNDFVHPYYAKPAKLEKHGLRRLYIGEINKNNPAPAEIAGCLQDDQAAESHRLYYVGMTRAAVRLYLPYFVGEYGDYLPIARRLERLVNMEKPEIPTSFIIKPFEADDLHQVTESEETLQWTPPALSMPTLPEFASLRAEHAAPRLTSFSGLRLWGKGTSPQSSDPNLEEDPAERNKAEGDDTEILFELGPNDLPGGTRTGNFLHEILENISPTSFVDTSFAEWREKPEVAELIEDACRRYFVQPKQFDHAYRIVWSGFTKPLQNNTVPTLPPLYQAERILREPEFLYPMGIEGADTFIKGFIDLVFLHNGKVYFADWKSNVIPGGYGTKAMQKLVEEQYRDQALLYAHALLRLFDIQNEETYEDRFGGFLYLFLRGMINLQPPSDGIYFNRPTWHDLQNQMRDLRTKLTPKVGAQETVL